MRGQGWRLVALLALLAGPGAWASGWVEAGPLPRAVRDSWAEEVAHARRRAPQAFEALEALVREADALDAQKRGPLAVLTPHLKALGPEALWPLVERLVFAPPAQAPESESARLALAVGLVEAAGALREARLAPLWSALLEGPEARPEVLHASAEALAKLETDEAARVLLALSRQPGPRGEAALAALGHCRRRVVALALAEALDARPEAPRALRLIRALGDVGSSWAWATPVPRARAEEGRVRRVAAEALLRAWQSSEGELRQAASQALLRVDAPETPALLQSARAQVGPSRRAALDALAERLRHNPLRRGTSIPHFSR